MRTGNEQRATVVRLPALAGCRVQSESGLAVKIRLQLDGIVFICIFSFEHEDGDTS